MPIGREYGELLIKCVFCRNRVLLAKVAALSIIEGLQLWKFGIFNVTVKNASFVSLIQVKFCWFV